MYIAVGVNPIHPRSKQVSYEINIQLTGMKV